MNPYLKQYQKNQIETATPERILIMLYDGAIQYLNIARNEMLSEGPKNVQKIHNNIIAAEKIITEFKCTLNMEIGGEVAQNLYELYTYMYKRLIEANVKKKVEAVDEVLWHLKELRATWQKAIEIVQKEKTAASTSARSLSQDDDDDEASVTEEDDVYVRAFRG